MSNFSVKQKQIFWAVITFAIYASLINWKAALVLMVGIGFHEMSHLFIAKKLGLQTRGFVFLPFVGGVSFVGGPYKTYMQQAKVVLGGPFGGMLLAFATAGVYWLTGYPFIAAAALWMVYINLFNAALPISFLDAGQLLDTITYSNNRTLGMFVRALSTLVGSVILWSFNPLIAILVMVFGGKSVIKEIQDWNNLRKGKSWLVSDAHLHHPAPLSRKQMLMVLGAWAGTVSMLTWLYYVLSSVPGASFNTILHG